MVAPRVYRVCCPAGRFRLAPGTSEVAASGGRRWLVVKPGAALAPLALLELVAQVARLVCPPEVTLGVGVGRCIVELVALGAFLGELAELELLR